MDLVEFTNLFKANKAMPIAFNKKSAVGKALSVQVHTQKVVPKYQLEGQRPFTPEDYDSRFDNLFKYKLLNQYPNESDNMYNYRLSIYSPIQTEISARFLTQATGTILNPNNYSINSESETFNNFLPRVESKFDYLLDFLLNNPTSFYAVVQTNLLAGEDSSAIPEIIAITADSIVMFDKKSVTFKHGGYLYFMDSTQMIILKEGKTKKGIEIVYTYMHGFGSLPFWQVNNKILDQFVVWCNEIVKSHSESQIVDKNFSYPIKQVVEQECNICYGKGQVDDEEKPDCETCTKSCGTCKGSGTISMSPGQVHTIPEHYLTKYNTIPDIAKFTTPDIGIPTYHSEKWQMYYEKAENALHLTKRGSASESGEAKREDRKDSYFYTQTISQILFKKVITPALKYIGWYLNVSIRDSKVVHEAIEIEVKEPRQFDLMSDVDLIEEVNLVATKSDSPMLLGEMTYAMNDKLYSESAELKKMNEVMYLADPLYGLTGNAEKVKLLSGVYSSGDKWLHTRGYFALKKMLHDKGVKSFLSTSINKLVEELIAIANTEAPTTIIPTHGEL